MTSIDAKAPESLPIRRRALLSCMTAAAGVVWTVSGGIPKVIGANAALAAGNDLTFAQISDTHIGFAKEPNTDPAGTLQETLDRLKAWPKRPAFLLHTGDVTHLSKPAEFDAAATIMGSAGVETHYVPGEHDVLGDDGAGFFQKFGTTAAVNGWYSFDHGGVHFVGLINVLNLKPGGLGYLGADQLGWLAKDLASRKPSTPIVVFAHMPLWAVYPAWGWGTDDAAQVLGLLKRFGSVTVLNGHIHQVLQKVEGHVTFHTARSTAFPQAVPGEGPGPGPLKVPAEKLKGMLGLRSVEMKAAKVLINDSSLDA